MMPTLADPLGYSERLTNAIQHLATKDGPLSERLTYAWENYLALLKWEGGDEGHAHKIELKQIGEGMKSGVHPLSSEDWVNLAERLFALRQEVAEG